ncbi:MAG TPA: murein L,D-transpeptidase catalytic domain family protein [Chryseosolibacter sp.]|nr:murein L,D-transpeptidase catalytic domain family protein [Chryseosolibacter sp.]
MKYVTLLLLCALLTASVNSTALLPPPLTTEDPIKKIITGGGKTAVAVFEDSVQNLYSQIGLAKHNLSLDAFRYAMIGYYDFVNHEQLSDKNIISIIDFSQASTRKRFYTIDLGKKKLIFNTYVSHGKHTGENYATAFSNIVHSNQSSLGFYITGETYVGSKGYSLKLDGMEPGINDNMRKRAVVMHDADYVSKKWIQKYGRLGRSQGCPALPKNISRKVIDTIKNKTLIFAYAKDEKYLTASAHLNLEKVFSDHQLAAN